MAAEIFPWGCSVDPALLERVKAYVLDPGVSSDPASCEFSFSIAGRAFFIVGLHPSSSRISRCAPVPCLAFNFHDQFQLLRTSGKFEKMQRSIRTRDVALQGSANPALKSFGEA